MSCHITPRGITAADPIPIPHDVEQSYLDDANRALAWRVAGQDCGVYDPHSLTGPLDVMLSPCVQQKIQQWQLDNSAPKLSSGDTQDEAAATKRREKTPTDRNTRYMSAQTSAWNRLTANLFFYKVSLGPPSKAQQILEELQSINRKLGNGL